MVGDERDELIEQVRQSLAPLAPATPHAVARILIAVATDEEQRADGPRWLTWVRTRLRAPMLSLGGAGALAAMALTVGYIGRGSLGPASPALAPAMAVQEPTTGEGNVTPGDVLDSMAPLGALPGQPTLQAMTDEGAANAPVVVDFIFEGYAERVSLVGDFNSWSADSTPMQRAGSRNVWVTSVQLVPGRHVYAFIVDGERWEVDPTRPAAPDADFGKPGSVLLVRPR